MSKSVICGEGEEHISVRTVAYGLLRFGGMGSGAVCCGAFGGMDTGGARCGVGEGF